MFTICAGVSRLHLGQTLLFSSKQTWIVSVLDDSDRFLQTSLLLNASCLENAESEQEAKIKPVFQAQLVSLTTMYQVKTMFSLMPTHGGSFT